MKIIKINFKGLGYCDTFQAKVKVYHNNKCIKIKETYNGSVTFNLEENQIYQIKAISENERVIKNIYVSEKDLNLCFAFKRALVENKVTFYLTDSNYENLKIMKGEIILWQKQLIL
ncbi:MAG: hypothetical protein IKE70_06265 [Bacilli bacterium]|nr:hypothetical protein [Bacilli bacterium]